jgi:hypothetical protein
MKTNGTNGCGPWDRKSKNIFVRSDGIIVYRLAGQWLIKGADGQFLLEKNRFRTHTRAKRLVDEIYPIDS